MTVAIKESSDRTLPAGFHPTSDSRDRADPLGQSFQQNAQTDRQTDKERQGSKQKAADTLEKLGVAQFQSPSVSVCRSYNFS